MGLDVLDGLQIQLIEFRAARIRLLRPRPLAMRLANSAGFASSRHASASGPRPIWTPNAERDVGLHPSLQSATTKSRVQRMNPSRRRQSILKYASTCAFVTMILVVVAHRRAVSLPRYLLPFVAPHLRYGSRHHIIDCDGPPHTSNCCSTGSRRQQAGPCRHVLALHERTCHNNKQARKPPSHTPCVPKCSLFSVFVA